MRFTISVDRPFHSVMLANALQKQGEHVQILSSAPRKYFKGLSEGVGNRLVPSPLISASHVFHLPLSSSLIRLDTCIFDQISAKVMPETDVLVGWATQCLGSARKVVSRGGRFLLDRACPHRDAQEAIIQRETELLGKKYVPQPAWYRDRQLGEYDLAEAILVPSEYTARSFPDKYRSKLVKAPLLGRCNFKSPVQKQDDGTFTVGVVGGSTIRKGYIHLLRAWEQLKLPNAKLLMRGGEDFESFPAMKEILERQTNVERIGYVPDLADFFRRCDIFVLPSVDDGFGMALFEAISYGVPCVATTNCGASELLESGREALVVEAGAVDELAAAILKLYESKELRRELTTNGRQAVTRITQAELYDKAIRAIVDSLQESDLAQAS
jgi:glycosyltransferase involved in cell wall biosynthesis